MGRKTIGSTCSGSICSSSSNQSQTSIRNFFNVRQRTPSIVCHPFHALSNTSPNHLVETGSGVSHTTITPSILSDPATKRQREDRNFGNGSSVGIATKRPKKHQQLYLDLGQKNFAANEVCKICGMLAVHGMLEDDKRHARICKEYQLGVSFALPLQQQRIVQKFNLFRHQSRATPASRRGSPPTPSSNKPAVIVEVRPTDGIALRKKVAQVRTIVDQALGFSAAEADESKTAYLCISSKRVVGIVLAHGISEGYRLLSSSSSSTNNAGLDRSQTPVKAAIGIHQMWVHAEFRGYGIASALIDAARSQMVFGYTIPVTELAFSSPTESGVLFAKHYTHHRMPGYQSMPRSCTTPDPLGGNVLVYDCVDG